VIEILNLGAMPPANSLLNSPNEIQEEFPLTLDYCKSCHNLQLRDCLDQINLYKNYLYVTPDSSSLKNHYKYLYDYLNSRKFLTDDSFVFEVGSNIGYFLSFIKSKVKKVLGMDPAENICKMAEDLGIETVCNFFDKKSATNIKVSNGSPDIIIARHCFAHNANPHDLMKGVVELLSENGKLVIENAYALNTIKDNEFDQIYHEHMFYYSIRSMSKLLNIHDLQLIDVLTTSVHGGSIIFIAEHKSIHNKISESVLQYLSNEENILNSGAMTNFLNKTLEIKVQLKMLITELKLENKTIYTYGATAKGNTLLNFVGVTQQEIPFCIDNTKIKHGKFLPKSKIKIISEEEGLDNPPDYFLLTAWNYQDEIIRKVRSEGNTKSKFIIPFPTVHIV
jgi:novobiocin biosynthesis protein NovU/D-mycarose 3-C-methyltransferase